MGSQQLLCKTDIIVPNSNAIPVWQIFTNSQRQRGKSLGERFSANDWVKGGWNVHLSNSGLDWGFCIWVKLRGNVLRCTTDVQDNKSCGHQCVNSNLIQGSKTASKIEAVISWYTICLKTKIWVPWEFISGAVSNGAAHKSATTLKFLKIEILICSPTFGHAHIGKLLHQARSQIFPLL